MPANCEICGSNRLRTISYGTEKLEEDLKLLIPQAQVQRMDLDTTRRKRSYERIINQFEEGEIDILVGTQMVSKGLDFDHVRTVGILDIDRMMHFPDFRSFERAFHLATQVSGRAGRREKNGKVVIQTSNPDSWLLNTIIKYDFENFFKKELSERKRFNYPPFSRLIKIILKNKDKDQCYKAALLLDKNLKKNLGVNRVLGPQEPLISKIRNQFLMEIYIKLERAKINLDRVKSILKEEKESILKNKDQAGTAIIFDVDPY